MHRKTLWIHTTFSLLILVLLGLLIAFNQNIPVGLLALAIGVYVVGNAVIHIKRDAFREDTVLEYFFMRAVVLIVLISAVGS